MSVRSAARTYWRNSSADFKSVSYIMTVMLFWAWACFVLAMPEPASLLAGLVVTVSALGAIHLTNYEEAPTFPTMVGLMMPMVLGTLVIGHYFLFTSSSDYVKEQEKLYDDTATKLGIVDGPSYDEYRDEAEDAAFMERDGVVVVRHGDKFEFFKKVEK